MRRLDFHLYPGQAEALQKVLGPKRTDVLCSCGVGGGKTRWLCTVGTILAYMNPPGVDGMLTEPIHRMIDDNLVPELETIWYEHEIPFKWNAGERKYYLPETGNQIWLRSAEKPHNLRGANIAWAGLDEAAYQRPETITVLQSRVRHPRAKIQRIFGATTPAGFNWTYEHWAKPDRGNVDDTALVTWPTWQNKAVMEANPDFVELMRRSMSKELFDQEVLGAFTVVGAGRTYYEFNRATHVRNFGLDPALPLDLCVDFNVAPGIWIVSQGKGTPHIPERAIDEITVAGELSTWAALEEFASRYPSYSNGQNVRVYGDATGQARKTTGLSDFDAIRSFLPQARVFVKAKNPREKDRTNAVNAILRVPEGSYPRAFVHASKCPRLLRDLEQVHNLKGTFQIDKASNLELTHASDAWGYKIQWCYPVFAQARQLAHRQGYAAHGRRS